MKKIIFTFALLVLVITNIDAQYGYRWVLKPSGTMSNLNCIFFPNGSASGYICGANGTILVSTNDGLSWNSKSTGINVNLFSFATTYPITNTTVCCGENGTILFTTNTGNNWAQLTSGTSIKLNCVVSYDTKLFAIGNNGIIIKSTWNGTAYPPFSQIQSGTSQNLKSIYLDSAYYICGDNGTILKSTNEGTNWQTITIPTAQNLNSIYSSRPYLYVCGNNGVFYFSSNYGQNWTSGTTGVTNNLNCLGRYSDYIIGSNGTLLYNHVGNHLNWEKISIPTTADLNYFSNSYSTYNFSVGSLGTILMQEIDTALMQININANNINTILNYRGVFDQSYFPGNNTPGFEWPRGSDKHLVFTTGLSASCRINGQLAQTVCSYKGEYLPGAIINGQFNDSSIFKLYKVSRNENPPGSDWMNWGCMVPYGAPYVDVNNNNIYEPLIDTPGVRNAAQTVFVCLTDKNPMSHTSSEGYGGGVTSPLMGIELHLTKWSYTYPSFNDVTFSKFEILNKGGNAWNKTYFAIVSDEDVGNSNDDWTGCDTIRNMGYGYNSTNNDGIYGTAPPAIGYDILKGPVNKRIFPNAVYNMSSFTRFGYNQFVPNESDPFEPFQAYLMMQGYKSDSAVWLDRTQPTLWGSYKKTKKIFYGDPETNEGWTAIKGAIINSSHDTIGIQQNELGRDYRITIGMGADNYTMLNGDTAVIWLAQIAARGTSNLNSVTKLKQMSDLVQTFFESNFTIGIKQISSEVPNAYSLNQNYPNPFNPVTKIKYSIMRTGDVKLVVYDLLGRKISELVNEKQLPGVYEVVFDALSGKSGPLASGVYFYRLETGNYTDTKKMIIIK